MYLLEAAPKDGNNTSLPWTTQNEVTCLSRVLSASPGRRVNVPAKTDRSSELDDHETRRCAASDGFRILKIQSNVDNQNDLRHKMFRY